MAYFIYRKHWIIISVEVATVLDCWVLKLYYIFRKIGSSTEIVSQGSSPLALWTYCVLPLFRIINYNN